MSTFSDKGFIIKKVVKINIQNIEYDTTLAIFRFDGEGKVKLKIEFIACGLAINGFNFEEEYSKYDIGNYPFIGVKKIEFKDLKTKEKIKFLLNINLDKDSYKTINEYEEEILSFCRFNSMENFKALQELEYCNFEDEFDILVCSYLLLKEKKGRIFNTSSKIFKLYTDKLYFIGIDLNDYKDNKYNFDKKDVDDIDEDISFKSKREELIEYFLNYIAYLIYYTKENTRNMLDIYDISLAIFEKYISLGL